MITHETQTKTVMRFTMTLDIMGNSSHKIKSMPRYVDPYPWILISLLRQWVTYAP